MKVQREAVARRVLEHFGSCLPPSRLLCFLDDEDSQLLKIERGAANRGLYGPIHDDMPIDSLPDYVTDLILVDDGVSIPFPRVIDDVVYLHGSTCEHEIGLTMTLAHELQHAIQHVNVRTLWAVNGLVTNLDRQIIDTLKLTWPDIPIEQETRIVSKRVARDLFGEQRVAECIERRIVESVTDADVADWQFIRSLTSSRTVDLDMATRQLFGRLQRYRSELEGALQEKRREKNPDFRDIDLNAYF